MCHDREPIPCQISTSRTIWLSREHGIRMCAVLINSFISSPWIFCSLTHTRIWSIGRPSNHAIFPKETSSHQPLGMSICQHCVDMGAADCDWMRFQSLLWKISNLIIIWVIIMSFSPHKIQTYTGDRCACGCFRSIDFSSFNQFCLST
jgi:hypothetical protein